MVDLLDIVNFLHELYIDLKGDQRDKLEEISVYFEKISNCLIDIGKQLSTNDLCSGELTAKLSYLEELRNKFPGVVGERISTAKGDEFDILLKNAMCNNTTTF